MEEQAIACFKCMAREIIREGDERLNSWPAWKPGVQPFPCPNCGEGPIWATEPREAGSSDDPPPS